MEEIHSHDVYRALSMLNLASTKGKDVTKSNLDELTDHDNRDELLYLTSTGIVEQEVVRTEARGRGKDSHEIILRINEDVESQVDNTVGSAINYRKNVESLDFFEDILDDVEGEWQEPGHITSKEPLVLASLGLYSAEYEHTKPELTPVTAASVLSRDVSDAFQVLEETGRIEESRTVENELGGEETLYAESDRFKEAEKIAEYVKNKYNGDFGRFIDSYGMSDHNRLCDDVGLLENL